MFAGQNYQITKPWSSTGKQRSFIHCVFSNSFLKNLITLEIESLKSVNMIDLGNGA